MMKIAPRPKRTFPRKRDHFLTETAYLRFLERFRYAIDHNIDFRTVTDGMVLAQWGRAQPEAKAA